MTNENRNDLSAAGAVSELSINKDVHHKRSPADPQMPKLREGIQEPGADGRIEIPRALRDRFDQLAAMYPQRIITAIHEAGHAVASKAFGGQIVAVSVDATHDALGFFSAHDSSLPDDREYYIKCNMIIDAAGNEAVCIADPKASTCTASDDQKLEGRAWKLVGRRVVESEMRAEIHRARKRANALLRIQWAAVLDVAEAVLRYTEKAEHVTIPFQESLEALDVQTTKD